MRSIFLTSITFITFSIGACTQNDEVQHTPSKTAAMQKQAKPNIVIIFTDDMGYGDVSSYGGDWVQTPHIDALAASGIRYTDGYTVAPVCGPSRAGLLSGAYPARFGIFWNPDTLRAKIPDSQPLLTDIIRSAGYKSAVVGKWNLANHIEDNVDDIYDPMIWGAAYWPNADNSYSGVWGEYGAGKRASGLWGPEKPGDEYLTDRLTQHAVNYIEDNKDNPFLLYLAYNSPHSPLEAHARYKNQVAHLPDEPTQIYAAMLLSIDDGVGRVMDTLRSQGLEDNTLVFFISDNGPAAPDFQGYSEDWPKPEKIGSTGIFSGHKRSFREGGIRVPFIMSWPDKIAAGQTSSTPVITTDLYPTIANITAAKVPASVTLDGLDLMSDVPHTRPLKWAAKQCNDQGCVNSGAWREGHWKLLVEPGEAPQLFNLKHDPSEQTDLSTAQTVKFKALMSDYDNWRQGLPKAAIESQKDNVIEKPRKSPPLAKVLRENLP